MRCDKDFFDSLAQLVGSEYHDANAQIELEGEGCPPTPTLTLNGEKRPIEPTSLQAIALTHTRGYVHGKRFQMVTGSIDVIALPGKEEADGKWLLVAMHHSAIDYHYNPYSVEAICGK